MKSLFFYLLQVIVVSGILYAYYYVALRNKKFHQYNRFYILGATLASILIPFLNIPVYFSNEDASAQWMSALQSLYGQPVVIAVGAAPVEEESIFTWQNLLYAFYGLIAIAGLAKILLSIYRLRKIIGQHPAEHLNGIRFINTAEPGTPFSFFRWLFWNNRIELSSQKGEQIFRHEIFHIEQKHSLDTVFMEMVTIVFWINPFFHIMKKELKAIHEFLADRFASNETEKWEYAEMLLMQALNTQYSLVHPFFHNQIKRRIAMITNPQKTSHQYLRKLLVLPLAALLITLFAFSYKEKQANPLPEITILDLPTAITDSVPSKAPYDIKADVINITGDGFNKENQQIPPTLIIFNGKEYTSEEFKDFTGEKKNDVVIDAKYVISTPANDKKALAKYGEKARGGVLELKGATIDTVPAKKIINVKLVGTTIQTDKQPLLVLDGVVKENADYQNTLTKIVPDDIESITVLKDASAESLYGPKGRNGVLLITTKDGVSGKTQPVIKDDLKDVVVTGYGIKKANIDSVTSLRLVPSNQVTKKVAGVQIEKSDTVRTGVMDIVVEERKPKLEEVTVTGYATKKVQGVEVKNTPAEKSKIEEVTVVGYPRAGKVNGVSVSSSQLDVEPAFPGGASAWYNFVSRNVDATAPLKKGAPAGQYTVVVRMKVDKDGRLSDFKAITNHGYGMEDAAIRVLEKSPYWNPGYRNGVAINSYKFQPIVFAVVNEKGEIKGEIPENTATIYPNPVKDNLSVLFNSKNSRTVGVSIVDMNGKTYTRNSLTLAKGSTTSSISTKDLAPGTYLLRVTGNDDATQTFKFVKE
ncbi:MAG: hypothetical protein DI535_19325 [Citrobacter freundii]|nr:MAG: hypothetical protein DI535_19325 [Citrobacter freundii]